VRAVKAAQLLERGFQSTPLAWLTPSLGTVDALQPINTDPPNLREEMCGKHRKRPAAENEDDSFANLPADSPYAVFLSSLRVANGKGAPLLQDAQLGEPVVVFTGLKPPPESHLAATPPNAAKPGRKPAARPAVATTVPTTVKPASLVAGSGASGEAAKPRARAKTLPKTAPKVGSPSATAAKSTPAPKTQKAAPKAAQKTSHAAAKPKADAKQ
jgi:D-alanyl-D-alanine carboxypeptidase